MTVIHDKSFMSVTYMHNKQCGTPVLCRVLSAPAAVVATSTKKSKDLTQMQPKVAPQGQGQEGTSDSSSDSSSDEESESQATDGAPQKKRKRRPTDDADEVRAPEHSQ